jgi:hypothetical protein
MRIEELEIENFQLEKQLCKYKQLLDEETNVFHNTIEKYKEKVATQGDEIAKYKQMLIKCRNELLKATSSSQKEVTDISQETSKSLNTSKTNLQQSIQNYKDQIVLIEKNSEPRISNHFTSDSNHKKEIIEKLKTQNEKLVQENEILKSKTRSSDNERVLGLYEQEIEGYIVALQEKEEEITKLRIQLENSNQKITERKLTHSDTENSPSHNTEFFNINEQLLELLDEYKVELEHYKNSSGTSQSFSRTNTNPLLPDLNIKKSITLGKYRDSSTDLSYRKLINSFQEELKRKQEDHNKSIEALRYKIQVYFSIFSEIVK